MNVSDSSPSTTSRSASSIKVSIFNTQYTIKQTDNLTEEDIRTLAEYRGSDDAAIPPKKVTILSALQPWQP